MPSLLVLMQTRVNYQGSSQLIILIENSYAGTIIKKDQKFRTSQKDADIHGIGLESVKQVVDACNGDMKIEYSKKRFQVQVLLYLSNIV